MPRKERHSLTASDSTEIASDQTMREAGRRVLIYHLTRLLREESGVLACDVEAVHDMRVATRRLRSAIRIFAPYFRKHALKSFNRNLRDLGRALGAVRDLDVFRLRIQAFAEGRSPAERTALQPLLENWQHKETAARAPLQEMLESARYEDFIEVFIDFLRTPGSGAIKEQDTSLTPHRVCDVLPILIYQQMGVARAYEAGFAHASLDTLHNLRIEMKRLRYLLEAFIDPLGDSVAPVIEAVKALQDHLGDLQDARVAVMLLNDYLKRQFDAESLASPEADAVRDYIAHNNELIADLRKGVPAAWAAFDSTQTRRLLAQAVAGV